DQFEQAALTREGQDNPTLSGTSTRRYPRMFRSSRRNFMKSSLTAACSLGLARSGVESLVPEFVRAEEANPKTANFSLKKGLVLDMVGGIFTKPERLKNIRDGGFEVDQAATTSDPR